MHRFRKKSDAKRSPYPTQTSPTTLPGVLPELPPENDFRTSLILPDLSRRFSVLRSSSGAPVSLDALRLKLAAQRARGDTNQVTEEEEDMLLESLGLRNRAATPSKSQENVSDADGPLPPSLSPASRSTKRYSNNLFGSSKFRDYTYIRNVQSKANSRVQSTASSDGQSLQFSHDPQPDVLTTRSATISVPTSHEEEEDADIPLVLPKSAYKRASHALQQAIMEIEEEDGPEDEVVLPRSPPIVRSTLDQHRFLPELTSSTSPRSLESSGMAISSDKQHHADMEDRRASPIPARALSGYIPGMPRPMTPRDTDSDEPRSYSTTPRATSPTFNFPNRNEGASPTFAASIMSNFALRDAQPTPQSSIRHSPAPTHSFGTTPLFLQRNPNGRHTPDDSRAANSEIAIDFDQSFNPSSIGRRAASPLSSSSASYGSRPGTPSNLSAWPQPPSSPPSGRRGHSRNASWLSSDGASTDAHGTTDQIKVPARSLRSPALPDSPLIDRGNTTFDTIASQYSFASDKRPSSPLSGFELGGDMSSNYTSRVLRSPTPTQDHPRSPASPTFSNGGSPRSKRSSRQNNVSQHATYTSTLNNPLVFSPPASSSRSSLESAGSSYHSWEGDKPDPLASLFNGNDAPQSAWYDVSASDKASSITAGGVADDEAESILQAVGLKRTDFMIIQEKLVEFASSKTSASLEGTPNRTQSLRRRRPSTSQSNYSTAIVAGRVSLSAVQFDTTSNSVQIASPPPQTPSSPQSTGFPMSSTDLKKDDTDELEEPSPTSRKNRAIADLLFGSEEPESQSSGQSSVQTQSPPAEDAIVLQSSWSRVGNTSPQPPHHTPSVSTHSIPYAQPHNLSIPKLPHTPEQEEELEREVERKTNAAMLALKGSSSKSNLNLSESHSYSGSASRKRISPNQISTPTLVSASTSVDAIPLRSPNSNSSSATQPKMSRFKKLQGTLRKPKQLPTGDEVTPFPVDLRSPGGGQTVTFNVEAPTSDPVRIANSAVEPRFKVTVPSPPATAGPGLKGFMARFRSKPRTIDPNPQVASRLSPHSFGTSSPDSSQKGQRGKLAPLTSAPPGRTMTGDSIPSSPATPRAHTAPLLSYDEAPQIPASALDNMAVQQFLDLGHGLGLDQEQLSNLVRSASTSSRATGLSSLSRNKSLSKAASLSRNNSAAQVLARNNSVTLAQSTTLKRNNSSVVFNQPEGHVDTLHGSRSPPPPPTPEVPVTSPTLTHLRSMRKPAPEIPRRAPPSREGRDASAQSAIVRRTIIMPSDFRASTFDVSKSSANRKRASTTSNRSVQERVPTPPPPRGGKRYSRDQSAPPPPVPHLPDTGSPSSEMRLQVPAMEPSNSNYESLYEMYGAESKPATPHGGYGGDQPALEVIELANGQTIWSIVNGLRDDDAESVYNGRVSMMSDYGDDDEMQVHVKEHQRTGSGSSSNYRQAITPTTPTRPNRPETKVFYSSPAHIGRLIENLSQGMEAGSFNFRGNTPAMHSHTSSMSSDPAWTMEERLDHMLGSMGGRG